MYPHHESSRKARARAHRFEERHSSVSEIPMLFGVTQDTFDEKSELERFAPHRGEFLRRILGAVRRRFRAKKAN